MRPKPLQRASGRFTRPTRLLLAVCRCVRARSLLTGIGAGVGVAMVWVVRLPVVRVVWWFAARCWWSVCCSDVEARRASCRCTLATVAGVGAGASRREWVGGVRKCAARSRGSIWRATRVPPAKERADDRHTQTAQRAKEGKGQRTFNTNNMMKSIIIFEFMSNNCFLRLN